MEASQGNGSTRSYSTVEASGCASLHAGDSHHYTRQAIGRDKFNHVSNFHQINHYNVIVNHARSETPELFNALQEHEPPVRGRSAPPEHVDSQAYTTLTPTYPHAETATVTESQREVIASAAPPALPTERVPFLPDFSASSREEVIEAILSATRVLGGEESEFAELRKTLARLSAPQLCYEAETLVLARHWARTARSPTTGETSYASSADGAVQPPYSAQTARADASCRFPASTLSQEADPMQEHNLELWDYWSKGSRKPDIGRTLAFHAMNNTRSTGLQRITDLMAAQVIAVYGSMASRT
ncbi:hypothetical protein LTR95_007679 [Oleoguttula sp. CCFEE 5521]